MTLKSFRRDERGAVVILFGLAVVPIMGLVGVGLDYARALGEKSGLQDAVDAAALAAVKTKTLQTSERTAIAKAMFDANKPAGLTVIPTVDATSGRVVVTASVRVPTTLMKVLHFDDVLVSATATAVKVFNGPPACVLALSKTASPAIDMSGNVSFTGKKCALHANSSATGAVEIGGSANVKADGYCAVGTVTTTVSLTPEPESHCDELADPYHGRVKEPTDLACDFNKKVVNDKKKTTALNPGVYCGGLSLMSDTELEPGLYVIRDGSLSMNAQGTITGTGVTFYLTGNGAGFDINGGAKLELSAMTTDPYKGLLIIQDRASNEGAMNKLNGNSGAVLTGAIYTPTQDLTLNGTGDFGQGSPHMPLVVNTVKMTGTNTATIAIDKKLDAIAPLPQLASGARLER
jgi:Flp pilus assembly protein TadG